MPPLSHASEKVLIEIEALRRGFKRGLDRRLELLTNGAKWSTLTVANCRKEKFGVFDSDRCSFNIWAWII